MQRESDRQGDGVDGRGTVGLAIRTALRGLALGVAVKDGTRAAQGVRHRFVLRGKRRNRSGQSTIFLFHRITSAAGAAFFPGLPPALRLNAVSHQAAPRKHVLADQTSLPGDTLRRMTASTSLAKRSFPSTKLPFVARRI
jgi:hypothetical protein